MWAATRHCKALHEAAHILFCEIVILHHRLQDLVRTSLRRRVVRTRVCRVAICTLCTQSPVAAFTGAGQIGCWRAWWQRSWSWRLSLHDGSRTRQDLQMELGSDVCRFVLCHLLYQGICQACGVQLLCFTNNRSWCCTVWHLYCELESCLCRACTGRQRPNGQQAPASRIRPWSTLSCGLLTAVWRRRMFLDTGSLELQPNMFCRMEHAATFARRIGLDILRRYAQQFGHAQFHVVL